MLRIGTTEWRDACIFLRELLNLNCREAVDLIRHFGDVDSALEAIDG